MTTPSTSNLLDRLATLSAQRTARTDRLHAAVSALLSRLADVCETGDSATVDGYTLTRVQYHTSIGDWTTWEFRYDHEEGESCCEPEEAVGRQGYRHGDFHSPFCGPSRDELIALAARAGEFVAALCEQQDRTVAELETATAAVEAATARIPE